MVVSNDKRLVFAYWIVLLAVLAGVASGLISIRQLAIGILLLIIAVVPLWISAWTDKNILLFLVVVEVLSLLKYAPIINKLSLLIFPVVFGVVVLRKKRVVGQKISKFKVLTPYCLFFLIVVCWYFTSGLAPIMIFKGRTGEGNFISYFRNFLNLLALLLPFFLGISLNDLKKVFTIVMWIYIIGLTITIICYITGLIGSTMGEGVVRIGLVARFTFYAGIFTLFFGKRMFGRWIHVIVCLCLLLNLFWGGGRMEFGMLLSAYIWLCFGFGDNRSGALPNLRRIELIVLCALVLIAVWVICVQYLPSGQTERIGELLNIWEAKAYDDNILGNSGRIEQWRYALIDSKWLAFGRGFTKYFDIGDYETPAVRQVETGGAHNLYISIFYTFGYVGFALFFVHLVVLSRKLRLLYKAKRYDETATFICVFLVVWYLLYAFSAAGISGYFFLAYFLTGYVLSFDTKPMQPPYHKLCLPPVRINHSRLGAE